MRQKASVKMYFLFFYLCEVHKETIELEIYWIRFSIHALEYTSHYYINVTPIAITYSWPISSATTLMINRILHSTCTDYIVAFIQGAQFSWICFFFDSSYSRKWNNLAKISLVIWIALNFSCPCNIWFARRNLPLFFSFIISKKPFKSIDMRIYMVIIIFTFPILVQQ